MYVELNALARSQDNICSIQIERGMDSNTLDLDCFESAVDIIFGGDVSHQRGAGAGGDWWDLSKRPILFDGTCTVYVC